MTFSDVLDYAASQPALVAEFDRLSGTHLSRLDRRSGLDALIDQATGRDDAAVAKFAAFVYCYVWLPLGGPDFA